MRREKTESPHQSTTSTDADVSMVIRHSVDSDGDFLIDMPKKDQATDPKFMNIKTGPYLVE